MLPWVDTSFLKHLSSRACRKSTLSCFRLGPKNRLQLPAQVQVTSPAKASAPVLPLCFRLPCLLASRLPGQSLLTQLDVPHLGPQPKPPETASQRINIKLFCCMMLRPVQPGTLQTSIKLSSPRLRKLTQTFRSIQTQTAEQFCMQACCHDVGIFHVPVYHPKSMQVLKATKRRMDDERGNTFLAMGSPLKRGTAADHHKSAS